jgi:hypothetical protein
LFFSSSRWPLVVSRGTLGALPGPLWLWLSSGMGGVDFVIMVSGIQRTRGNTGDGEIVPRRRGRRIVAGRKSRFGAAAAAAYR